MYALDILAHCPLAGKAELLPIEIRGLDFMTNFFGSLWSDFGFGFGGIFKVNFVVNLGGDFGGFLAKMHIYCF